MLGVKILDDFLIKDLDIKTFKIQLLRDQKPFPIDTATQKVHVLIADKFNLYVNEEVDVIEAENGIIQFPFKAEYGEGSFDVELMLTNEDESTHLTFPDGGFSQLKISACLSKRAKAEGGSGGNGGGTSGGGNVSGEELDITLTNYYNKEQIDAMLEGKANTEDIGEIEKALEEILGTTEGISVYVTENELKAELNTKLNDYSLNTHTHEEYATAEHNHDDRYALVGHTHDNVLTEIPEHNHDDKYATIDHVHTNYLTTLPDHTHSIASVNGLQTELDKIIPIVQLSQDEYDSLTTIANGTLYLISE